MKSIVQSTENRVLFLGYRILGQSIVYKKSDTFLSYKQWWAIFLHHLTWREFDYHVVVVTSERDTSQAGGLTEKRFTPFSRLPTIKLYKLKYWQFFRFPAIFHFYKIKYSHSESKQHSQFYSL